MAEETASRTEIVEIDDSDEYASLREWLEIVATASARKAEIDAEVALLSEKITTEFPDVDALVWRDAAGQTRRSTLMDRTDVYHPSAAGLEWLRDHNPILFTQITKRSLDAEAFNAAVESGEIDATMLRHLLNMSEDGTPLPSKSIRPRLSTRKVAQKKETSA